MDSGEAKEQEVEKEILIGPDSYRTSRDQTPNAWLWNMAPPYVLVILGNSLAQFFRRFFLGWNGHMHNFWENAL